MDTRTESNVIHKKTFVQKIMELRKKYTNVLAAPDWKELEIPREEPSEEEYDKKVRALWENAE